MSEDDKNKEVNLSAVYCKVTVSYKLSCFLSGGSEAQSEYYVIKSGFEENQQVFTCDTLLSFCLVKEVSELSFLQSVKSLALLLFSEL